MELATTLKSQAVRVDVREVGINPNHWYAVGWAERLQAGQVMPIMLFGSRRSPSTETLKAHYAHWQMRAPTRVLNCTEAKCRDGIWRAATTVGSLMQRVNV